MEDRFADQPEEVICSCPELRDICEALCSVIEEVDLTDHVSEAEYKTAADQGRDQWREDLAQGAHDLLERVLVCLGRRLHGVLAHALDPCVSGKFIVENGDIISDDDLILAGLCERALDAWQLLDRLFIRFLRINKNKTHSCHTVGNGLDIRFPADEIQQTFYIIFILSHRFSSFPFYKVSSPILCRTCLNNYTIACLFKHVNDIFGRK